MGQTQTTEYSGYRVLSVLPGSPGISANLDSYFDFITEAAGVRLNSPEQPFTDIIQQHVGRVLKLKVYNCMTQTERIVDLQPRNDWGGSGLLGITIRFDNYENVVSEVIHILKCEPNSPSEKAGLRPLTDYLLGTSDQVFHDENELAEACLQSVRQPMFVYVYNSKDERVRQVSITPSYEWGGEGLLGCDIGSGYLHQLPSRESNNAGTVSANALAALPSKRVRTMHMGLGWVEECRGDGFMSVKLGKYSKRRRSNVAVIIVKIVLISAFLFYCLLLNHSFKTNPNRITNCFQLFSLLQLYNYIAPASLFDF